MTYTDADFARMETDATLTRRYLWACFKEARLISAVEWLGTISDADLLKVCSRGEERG